MFLTRAGGVEFLHDRSNTGQKELNDMGSPVSSKHAKKIKLGKNIATNPHTSSVGWGSYVGSLYNSGAQMVSDVTTSSVEMTKRMASGVVSTSSMLASVGVDLGLSAVIGGGNVVFIRTFIEALNENLDDGHKINGIKQCVNFLVDAQSKGDHAKVVLKAMLNPTVIEGLSKLEPVGNNVTECVAGLNKLLRSLSSGNSNDESEPIDAGKLKTIQNINNKLQQLPNLRSMFTAIAREMSDAQSDVSELVDASVELAFFVVTDWLVRRAQSMT